MPAVSRRADGVGWDGEGARGMPETQADRRSSQPGSNKVFYINNTHVMVKQINERTI